MTCPICGQDTVRSYKPFCSKRCADRDLARWFNGSYTVASQDPDETEDLEEALSRAEPAKPAPKPH
ncbi:MAG: DNA gyrase inhibitor YacG [Pseudomonadota bacterium]